ncbi:MAG: magnesium transporter [Lachnospiraceae bacterium]|nr:magnesium transporter [Lachnospiraceae bacterium]
MEEKEAEKAKETESTNKDEIPENEKESRETEEPEIEEQNYEDELIEIIRSNLTDEDLLRELEQYHENDIAGALERVTPDERKKLYRILGPERVSEIFTYIENVEEYLKELSLQSVAKIIENMDSDDAVEVLEEMDDSTQEKLEQYLTKETREDIHLIQSYDDDEIGSRMTTNYISITKDMSVKQAMKALISQAEENDNISTIYATEEDGTYYGALDLKDLIVARQGTDLKTLISTSYPYVTDIEDTGECIERIREYSEDSYPVLDTNKKLLGIITATDIVEVVDDEMGDDYAKLAGLTAEEDLHETLPESMRKRLPWLIILLLLGIAVSTVVGMFETVVSKIALVVAFQSLILDMAGNVGTQSLAVTIRVLVDEELKTKQKVGLVFKEMRVGLFNGLLLGTLSFAVVGLYIMLAKGMSAGYSFMVSGCVGFSLMVAMIISSFVGTVVPMFFHRIKVDPAVASGPLITTVNDLVAVVTYYGLVWILLINMLGLVS